MPISRLPAERLSDLFLRQWGRGLLLLVLLWAGHALQVDERVRFALGSAWPPALAQPPGAATGGYRVQVEAHPLSQVADNLSGLAYDAQRDQLWAVVNDPPELLALGRDGALRARYPLQGFEDVEGVASLGGDLLLVSEERRHALVVLDVPTEVGPLVRAAQRSIALTPAARENSGFEGVAYDREGDRLFVVKEHTPRALYEIRGLRASLAGGLALEIVDRSGWIRDKFMASDLASVEYDPRSGRLLLLSEASRVVLELDADGTQVGAHALRRGFSGLAQSVPQAEGLALAGDGTLYLVSEPNLFYAFSRD